MLEKTPRRLRGRYKESVPTTWKLSFHSVSRLSPIAANLLLFLAFIGLTDVPLPMFRMFLESMDHRVGDVKSEVSVVIARDFRYWRDTICPEQPVTEGELEDAFITLESFSSIRKLPTPDNYSMHSLVHAWGFDRLGPGKKLDLSRAVVPFMRGQVVLSKIALPVLKLRLVTHVTTHFNVRSSLGPRRDLTENGNDTCKKPHTPIVRSLEDWSIYYKI